MHITELPISVWAHFAHSATVISNSDNLECRTISLTLFNKTNNHCVPPTKLLLVRITLEKGKYTGQSDMIIFYISLLRIKGK